LPLSRVLLAAWQRFLKRASRRPSFVSAFLSNHLRREEQLRTQYAGSHSPLAIKVLGQAVEAAGSLTGVLLAMVLPLCDVLQVRPR
jgi:hypothetical protein